MSVASPLSPVSATSELHFAIDDMPTPQRPIERMSSYPSLSHSSTTATSDDVHDQLNAALLTPTDMIYSVDIGTRDDIEVLSPVVERKGGFRGLTKSMQSLRGRAKADKERSRSTSRERPPMPVLEPAIRISPPPQITKPMAIPRSSSSNAVPSRPKPQRSGSSFSSFIKKLTGGGKSSKPSPPAPTVTPHSMPVRAATMAPREPVRKPTLAINTSASPPTRPPVLRKTSLPLDIMSVKPDDSLKSVSTTSDAYLTLSIDPRTVPLPPSPPSPALVLPEDDAHDFSLSPSSYDKIIAPGPSSLTCSPSLKQVKQIGKLRLEGVDSSPAQLSEAIEEGSEEEEEEDDVVQPLRSVTSQSSRRIVDSPVTASTFNDEVQTPTSPSFNDNVVIRQNSSSPPRFNSSPSQPEVTAPRKPEGLGRKESKWRKSVMNLSETLNGTSKKISKAPPTSYDNYLAHQQRMATHRRSCAPTLHSTASVSAEIRQIKDKEQQDVADTFFLS